MGSKLSQAVSYGAQGRQDLAQKAMGNLASTYTEYEQKFSLGGQEFKFSLSKPINVNLKKRTATSTLNVSWIQASKDFITIEFYKDTLFGVKTIIEKIKLTDQKKYSFEVALDSRSIALTGSGADVRFDTTIKYVQKSLFNEVLLDTYYPGFIQKIKSE
jgi:hypothetical protein